MNDQEKARMIAEKVMKWTEQKLSGGMGWIDRHESAAEHPDIRSEDRELYDFPVFKAWAKDYNPAANVAQAIEAIDFYCEQHKYKWTLEKNPNGGYNAYIKVWSALAGKYTVVDYMYNDTTPAAAIADALLAALEEES